MRNFWDTTILRKFVIFMINLLSLIKIIECTCKIYCNYSYWNKNRYAMKYFKSTYGKGNLKGKSYINKSALPSNPSKNKHILWG